MSKTLFLGKQELYIQKATNKACRSTIEKYSRSDIESKVHNCPWSAFISQLNSACRTTNTSQDKARGMMVH